MFYAYKEDRKIDTFERYVVVELCHMTIDGRADGEQMRIQTMLKVGKREFWNVDVETVTMAPVSAEELARWAAPALAEDLA